MVNVEPSGWTSNVGYFLQYVDRLIFVTTARLALKFRACPENAGIMGEQLQKDSIELISLLLKIKKKEYAVAIDINIGITYCSE